MFYILLFPTGENLLAFEKVCLFFDEEVKECEEESRTLFILIVLTIIFIIGLIINIPIMISDSEEINIIHILNSTTSFASPPFSGSNFTEYKFP